PSVFALVCAPGLAVNVHGRGSCETGGVREVSEMSKTCLVAIRVAATAFSLVVGLASPLLAQRSDRALISGVVTDPQGAGVPGATVTIRNDQTGVSSVLVT